MANACLEAAFPGRCPGCGLDTGCGASLCPACRDLAICAGGPDREPGPGGLETVTTLARYRDPLGLVLRDFKYRRHYIKGRALGRLAVELAPPELLAGAEVMAPVPLHRLRLMARGFNQSCVIFRPLAQGSGLAFEPGLLLRTRRTRPQTRLDRKARLENVAGAFCLNPARKAFIRGREVILVDDVFTTGATLAECGRVLLEAGAGRVRAVVLARPVIGGENQEQ